jgi:hypothetical protein
MPQWEYKTLTYGIEGKVMYSLRFWEDASRRAYGPKERARLIGGIHQQMRQLEAALKELDQEGWEVVSVSICMTFFTRHGVAVLRRPARAVSESSA